MIFSISTNVKRTIKQRSQTFYKTHIAYGLA